MTKEELRKYVVNQVVVGEREFREVKARQRRATKNNDFGTALECSNNLSTLEPYHAVNKLALKQLDDQEKYCEGPLQIVDGAAVAYFGEGFLSVGAGYPMDDPEKYNQIGIGLNHQSAGEIGKKLGSMDFEKPFIQLIFSKKESIDVVIRALEDLKSKME